MTPSLLPPGLLAGNLAFPLLLVGGLFLLSRRQGGPMGPGGPGNPLAFGKSRARFQMEPNTGVTFADVAGVDEAKQDFMEVRGLGAGLGRAWLGFGRLWAESIVCVVVHVGAGGCESALVCIARGLKSPSS